MNVGIARRNGTALQRGKTGANESKSVFRRREQKALRNSDQALKRRADHETTPKRAARRLNASKQNFTSIPVKQKQQPIFF